MPESDLKNRQQALEDAFFTKEAEALRARLNLERETEEAAEALADASGITDSELLAQLAGLGIRADTLAALTLVPLVEVAWADEKMEDAERQAVLRGAESTGLAPESPSHGLLRLWIEDRPAPDLMRLWSEYIRALCEELTGEQRERLAQRIVGRAKEVAEAAGGFLGLGSKISRVEQQMLAKMEQVFSG